MKDRSSTAQEAWRAYVASHDTYIRLGARLVAEHRPQLAELVRTALGSVCEAIVAYNLIDVLSDDERLGMLPELLRHCSSGRYAHRAKRIIIDLPRESVLERIETSADAVLASDDFLDWCNILDVYDKLDADLALRLAVR